MSFSCQHKTLTSLLSAGVVSVVTAATVSALGQRLNHVVDGALDVTATAVQSEHADELGNRVERTAENTQGKAADYTAKKASEFQNPLDLFVENAVRGFIERDDARNRIAEVESHRRDSICDEYRKAHPELATMPNLRTQNFDEVFTIDQVSTEDLRMIPLLKGAQPDEAAALAKYAKQFEVHYNAWEAKKYGIFTQLAYATQAHTKTADIRTSLVSDQRMWEIARTTVPLDSWRKMYTEEDALYQAVAGILSTLTQHRTVPVMPTAVFQYADSSGILAHAQSYSDAQKIVGVYRELIAQERQNIETVYSTKTAQR